MRFREILRIALRYSLAFGRGQLSVFMASLSVLGLVLGTAILLTVLSVMNGFDREMRERILALVPHVTVHTLADRRAAEAQGARLLALPGVRAVRPFAAFQGLVARGTRVVAVTGLGLDAFPAPLREQLQLPPLPALSGIVLGDSVATRLQVDTGDAVRIIVPARRQGGPVTIRRLPVAAVVDSGTELDETLLLLPLSAAAELAGLGDGLSGLQLQLDDPFGVDRQMFSLRSALDPGNYLTTWKMSHGNLYAAIQLSRELVVLLLASIVGVAAFNVVSALVLVVIDKTDAIAVLRTMGATRLEMATLFLLQGLLIGAAGAAIGCALGALLCLLLPSAVTLLEQWFALRFLDTDVYPVSFIPVDLRASDALVIATTAIGMCLLAALYPALRAAQLQPARVLNQDP